MATVANKDGIGGIDATIPSKMRSKLLLADGVTAPSTLSGTAQIYVDKSDGDLKVRYADGTVKVIVADT